MSSYSESIHEWCQVIQYKYTKHNKNISLIMLNLTSDFMKGHHKDCECAIVEVKDITYNEGQVEYYLGKTLDSTTKE